MKLERFNASPNHLSHVKNGEEPTNIDDGFLDAQLFHVDIADDSYAPIIQFLATSVSPTNMLNGQKKQLVVYASDFQLIVGQLYNLGPDEIL